MTRDALPPPPSPPPLAEYLELVLHDLQTPLSTLLLWEGVLRATIDDPARRGEALDAIHRCVEQQAQLVRDLRDVTRASQGRLELARVRVGLAQVLREAGAQYPGGIVLPGEAELATERWVLADAQLLRRAFERLFEHATELARAGGVVGVSMSERERELVVRAEVRGPGIAGDGPPPMRLALVIARELLRVQGGELHVHDPRSRFEVRLPTRGPSAP